ncbi:XRE family transcriptional regulator [Alsobacter sp. SYSU BS001988]
MSKPVPMESVIASFSPERERKIAARAEQLTNEYKSLQDVRRSRGLTQREVAGRVGGRQEHVSRLEQRADMKVSTLREYVRALGGDLHLIVTFPDGETVQLDEIGRGS